MATSDDGAGSGDLERNVPGELIFVEKSHTSNGDDLPLNTADDIVTIVPPDMHINRELSWLDFNARVLAEAEDPGTPLLERAKFVAIHARNLEEFFMIRVAGLKRKVTAGITEPGPDGRSPSQTYSLVRGETARQLTEASSLFTNVLNKLLKLEGINISPLTSLSRKQRLEMELLFDRDIFPVLTPQGIDRARRFPHISNSSLNLIVVLQAGSATARFARVKVPAVLPRLIRLKANHPDRDNPDGKVVFVWLEEVIAAHLNMLFPGNEVIGSYPFHVTRDSDIEFDDEDDDQHDLLNAMRELLTERTFGSVIKMTVGSAMPGDVRHWLTEQLGASAREVYFVDGPMALGDLSELLRLDRPELMDPPFTPAPLSRSLGSVSTSEANSWGPTDVFELLRQRDILIHHPYQSFLAVSDFLRLAATDPDVVAIKQTLYRIGRDSPLIPALIEARDDDTQVAVLLELKARFDEESNMNWAEQLEQHGVHVAYGVAGLKTHCKLTLVVRREADGLRRYAHLATGNYNATTARIYEDIGLFTARGDLASDVSELFNVLTGYSLQEDYRRLLVAPNGMRDLIIAAVMRETELHLQQGGGRLIFKMNALVDRQLIRALYTASRSGVEVDLIVRGSCCLRPGIPGWSESIRVRSIVGRFLEHSRIYFFGNGGDPKLLLGSADMMERNLDRRVEVLFPVDEPQIADHLEDAVLDAYLRDNVNSWILGSDAIYQPPAPPEGVGRFDVQQHFIELYSSEYGTGKSFISDV